MIDLPPPMPKALCRVSDPTDWDEGGREWLAKAICSGCPEREPCRDYALTTPVPVQGVWGGLTSSERGHVKSGIGRRGPRHYTATRKEAS